MRGPGPGGDARRVLEERARALARRSAAGAEAQTVALVTFGLAEERYGIEAERVLQVFRLRELTPLPGAAPPVYGVAAWRGDLLTILDLRSTLGIRVRGLTDLSRVVVVGDGRARFGILADAIHELVEVPVHEIRPPREGVALNREYLRGLTGDALLVLDAARILQLHG
jgi:purine-binding chemotaxis protein CheW